MKILYVVPYMPNSLRVRSLNFIRNLTGLGHRVTVVAPWTYSAEQEDAEILRRDCHAVHTIRLRRLRSMWNCAIAVPSGQPLQAAFSWHPQLAETAHSLIEDGGSSDGFDLIHVEHLRAGRYGLWLQQIMKKDRIRIPIVWDSVDCISHLFELASKRSASLVSRSWTRVELGRTRSFEARLLTVFDRVLFTSQIDRREMARLLNTGQRAAKSSVVTNGVDLERLRPPKEGSRRQDQTIVVSGKMSYHANVSMVCHLMNDIMPRIWQDQPGVKVQIVGADPPPALERLGRDPRVEVTGTVPDLAPYLQGATLAAVPLVYGAGIQNKVLEAMACGTPVVAAPDAVRSLEAVAGKDLVIAADDQAFSLEVLALLSHPERRKSIGEAGRSYVEAHHSWTGVTKHLEEVYGETLNTEHKPAG